MNGLRRRAGQGWPLPARDGFDRGRVYPGLQRLALVRVPLIVRGPGPCRDQDGDFRQGRAKARVVAQELPQALRPVAQFGTRGRRWPGICRNW